MAKKIKAPKIIEPQKPKVINGVTWLIPKRTLKKANRDHRTVNKEIVKLHPMEKTEAILAHQLQMTHCEPGAANGMLYVLLPKYRQLYEGCEGVLTLVRVIERHVYDDGHQAPTGFDHFRCEFLSPGGLIELPMSYVKQAYCQNGNMGMMDDELQT